MELELPPPPKFLGHLNGISSVPLSPTDTLVEELTLQPAKSETGLTTPAEDEKGEYDSKLDVVQVLQVRDGVQQEPKAPGDAPSTTKKYVLLIVFCLAQFLDAVNNSAIFPAIPTLAVDLNIKTNNTVWVVSATQLTFASFLLLVSRDSVVVPFLRR